MLGTGTSDHWQTIPAIVPALADKVVTKFYVNPENFAFVVTNDNQVYVWGVNEKGRLGIGEGEGGTLEDKKVPTIVRFP